MIEQRVEEEKRLHSAWKRELKGEICNEGFRIGPQWYGKLMEVRKRDGIVGVWLFWN